MDTQNRIILWTSAALVILVVIIGAYVVATTKPTPLPRKDGLLSLPLDQTDHTEGSKTPKVTIVEYSDFQCPACAAYYPMVEQIFTEYQDRISFTYRNFPLPQHQNAIIAAYAAEAAGLQGKFWEMGDVLFKNQNTWALEDAATAETTFELYAQKIGIDIPQFKSDENSDVVKNKVDRDQKSGFASAIDHTPTFFINGKMVNNPTSADEFKALIDYAITHP